MLKKINLWKKLKNKKSVKRIYTETQYEQVEKDQYFIIDVRTRTEYLEYHLNGSINIPLTQLREKIEKIQPDKEKKILLCCQTGGRSAKAAKILEKLGYHNLYNLKGGLENI